MQIPLQVSFHQVPHSDAVEAYVRKKVDKLERFHGRITGCRVAVEPPPHHHGKGSPFHVRIEVSVPGDLLVVNRDPGDPDGHEDVYVLLRDAFDAATRMVEQHVRVRRDQERAIPVATS